MKLCCLLLFLLAGCACPVKDSYAYTNFAGMPPPSDNMTFLAGVVSGFLIGMIFGLVLRVKAHGPRRKRAPTILARAVRGRSRR